MTDHCSIPVSAETAHRQADALRDFARDVCTTVYLPDPLAVAIATLAAATPASTNDGDGHLLRAAHTVLADREAELLAAKGSCSDSDCRLHYAHRGPHDIRSARGGGEQT